MKMRHPGLPNIRECLDCHQERRIVAHGLCDRCRKKQDREETKLKFTPATSVSASDAHKSISTLYKLMERCKAPSGVQRKVLKELAPYLGFTPAMLKAYIESIEATEQPAPLNPYAVHRGSSLAAADSTVRQIESDERVTGTRSAGHPSN